MQLSEFQIAMLALNLISSCVIVYRGVFEVSNKMGKNTYFPFRLAWVLMTTGAAAILVGPLFGLYLTGTYSTLIHIGVALFIFSDRRLRIINHA